MTLNDNNTNSDFRWESGHIGVLHKEQLDSLARKVLSGHE